LIEPCILAGCAEGGTILDPFFGAGTTGVVAANNSRHAIGIELNAEYIDLAAARLRGEKIVAKPSVITLIPSQAGITLSSTNIDNRQMSLL